MMAAGRVGISTNDQARRIDALHEGISRTWIVDVRVGAAVIDEAMPVAACIDVRTNDLARIVDTSGKGTLHT